MQGDLHEFSETFTSDFLLLPLTPYGPHLRQRPSHRSKTCTLQNDLLQVQPVMVLQECTPTIHGETLSFSEGHAEQQQ